MSETVLLRFLGSGLVNVGGDDAKLEKLQATAAAVSAILKKAPSKVSSYALIAFDPNAAVADPVIAEVLACLKEQWPTYVNTFASAPIPVLRAIILDALVEAAREDDRVAVAVAANARNILPFMETGNESAIWVEVVNEIESCVDARAEEEWSTPSSIEIINTGGWSITAENLAQMALKGRDDLRPTLRECQGLLGFWTRFKLELGAASSDEKWHELASMAVLVPVAVMVAVAFRFLRRGCLGLSLHWQTEAEVRENAA